MNKLRIALFGFGLLTVVSASASAQRRSSLVVGIGAPHSPASKPPVLSSAHGEGERAVRIANGALIGAGIGAAIGLIASPIVNAQNGDHSEDAMTYVVLPAFGAFLGLIFGGIAGLMRGS